MEFNIHTTRSILLLAWLMFGGTALALALCLYLASLYKMVHLHETRDSESFGIDNALGFLFISLLQRDYSVNKELYSIRYKLCEVVLL